MGQTHPRPDLQTIDHQYLGIGHSRTCSIASSRIAPQSTDTAVQHLPAEHPCLREPAVGTVKIIKNPEGHR